MRRVMVMGCSGSGKSTFALALSARTGIPYVSMDALYWQPGWKAGPPDTFGARATEAAAGDAWIIDGNFLRDGAGQLRRQRADTLIWFDLPRWRCLTGVLGRIARSYGRVRPEMAPGCPEHFDIEFLRYVWNFRAAQRPGQLAFIAGLQPEQRLVTFTSRRQADTFLAAEAG